jgi:hypothetical protein
MHAIHWANGAVGAFVEATEVLVVRGAASDSGSSAWGVVVVRSVESSGERSSRWFRYPIRIAYRKRVVIES